MNISKSIQFILRRTQQITWHKGQRLSSDPPQQDSEKIIEYQDRWTMTPARTPFVFDNGNTSSKNNLPHF